MVPTTTTIPVLIAKLPYIPYRTKQSVYMIQNSKGININDYINISNTTFFGSNLSAWKMSILFSYKKTRWQNQNIIGNTINLMTGGKGWYLEIDWSNHTILFYTGTGQSLDLTFKNMKDSNNQELNGVLQENILYQLDISYSNKAYEFILIYDIKYNSEGNYSGKLTNKINYNNVPLVIDKGYITLGAYNYGSGFLNKFMGIIYAISVIDNSSPETEVTFMLPKKNFNLDTIMLQLPK
jgi:hypothetical protein